MTHATRDVRTADEFAAELDQLVADARADDDIHVADIQDALFAKANEVAGSRWPVDD